MDFLFAIPYYLLPVPYSKVISYHLSSHQSSVISYQSSVISHQLSVISYQVISHQSSVISYQLSSYHQPRPIPQCPNSLIPIPHTPYLDSDQY